MTIQCKQGAGRTLAIAVALAVALLAGPGQARRSHDRALRTVPLSASTMIIEFNASAEDVGIQVFLDSGGWREIEVFDPLGKEIFGAEAEGSLVQQGGGTELFLESVEPGLDELPLDVFFARFPEGEYKFRGRTAEGDRVVGQARFSHAVPAGPEIVSPAAGAGECAVDVALPAVIAWDPVTTSITGAPLDIVRYEVIVEGGGVNFDVVVPAAAGTQVTVPPEVLEAGADYIFEVLAIEKGGNQTISEGCFATAS